MWAAITVEKRDKTFFESNQDLLVDLVSETIKSNHPESGYLSRNHTQAWERQTTEALHEGATRHSPTPGVSIVFRDPFEKFDDVYRAHKDTTIASHLQPVNTSLFVGNRKYKRWVLPPGRSVSRGIGTGAGSRTTRDSDRLVSILATSIPLWLKDVDTGYSGDEED